MTIGRPRRWSELTPAEAAKVFDEYVGAHTTRLRQFFEEVRDRRGPLDTLDFGRASLGPLWAWIMETYPPPAQPVGDAEMRAQEPPWWYDFHAPLGQRIGPQLARVVTLTAAYLAETIMRRRPGSTWVIGKDERMADHNQPLLNVPGRGLFLPDSVLLVAANQWANNVIASPDRLIDIFDTRAGPDEPTFDRDRDAEDTTAPYEVRHGAQGPFDTVITFDEIVAHEEAGRIERLVVALGNEPGVEEAVHEDREIVLARAPRLDARTVQETVDRLWERSA